MRRCGSVAEPRPDVVECARPSGYLAVRLCPCSDGHSAVFCLSAAETKSWVALEGVADCRSWHFWASAWYGQQGERFVAVDRRRCIRMPFVPPCLMYSLSILQKRCVTNGSARQKLGKRYERRKTHGLRTSLYASDERAPVGRAATMSGKPCRSSQKRRRSFCSSAFGRATSGHAAPRPYLKATKQKRAAKQTA